MSKQAQFKAAGDDEMLERLAAELQPIANADGEVQDALDDLVYQAYPRTAGKRVAGINNQGVEYQLKKIAKKWGVESTYLAARKILDHRKAKG